MRSTCVEDMPNQSPSSHLNPESRSRPMPHAACNVDVVVVTSVAIAVVVTCVAAAGFLFLFLVSKHAKLAKITQQLLVVVLSIEHAPNWPIKNVAGTKI